MFQLKTVKTWQPRIEDCHPGYHVFNKWPSCAGLAYWKTLTVNNSLLWPLSSAYALSYGCKPKCYCKTETQCTCFTIFP